MLPVTGYVIASEYARSGYVATRFDYIQYLTVHHEYWGALGGGCLLFTMSCFKTVVY